MFSLMQQSELRVRWPNVQVSASHIIRHTDTHTYTKTHTHTHTNGRTLLNEWSAGLRGRYIHKTHRAQWSAGLRGGYIHKTHRAQWSAGLRGRYIHKTHRAQKTKFHASSGVRSCDPSNRDAVDLSLREHDHQDWRTRQRVINI